MGSQAAQKIPNHTSLLQNEHARTDRETRGEPIFPYPSAVPLESPTIVSLCTLVI